MHKLISPFLWFSLFVPCLSCNQIKNDSFLFEAPLTAQYSFPIHDAFAPVRMYVKNNYLILSQSNLPNYRPEIFFQAYSISDHTYQGSFGQKGRGPGEWLNAEIIHSSNSSPYLYIYDATPYSTATIYKMLLDSTMQLKEVGLFTVEKGNSFMNRPTIRRDSLLVFDEYMPEPAIRIYHLNQEHPVITWKYGTSSLEQRQFEENTGSLYANDSSIVFLYRYKNRLDFMDWNLILKKSLSNQKGTPVFHEDPSDNVTFYGNAFFGTHFLFASYSGMSGKERVANHFMGSVMEVYDPNGVPVCRYTFPEKAPSVFAVDENTFTLYGYRGADGMEDSISVYQMPYLVEYLQKKYSVHEK